jgi:hypothetical protein
VERAESLRERIERSLLLPPAEISAMARVH